MHSIVSQGKVDAVLASRPEDRRALIEEAAGLGKFKRRRHRAELKLARVATRSSARDVEDEVRKRLRPLALQATAAERAEKLASRDLEAARPRGRSRPGARSQSAPPRPRSGARPRRSPAGARRSGCRRCSRSGSVPRTSSATRPGDARPRWAPSTGCAGLQSASRCAGSGRGAAPRTRRGARGPSARPPRMTTRCWRGWRSRRGGRRRRGRRRSAAALLPSARIAHERLAACERRARGGGERRRGCVRSARRSTRSSPRPRAAGRTRGRSSVWRRRRERLAAREGVQRCAGEAADAELARTRGGREGRSARRRELKQAQPTTHRPLLA